MNSKINSVFLTSFFEQKKSLKKLIEESRADADFYLLLMSSAIITTLGLIINSVIIVIGGMLVAPLLFPILSLAMGITTSNKNSILRSSMIILRSSAFVFLISLIISFLFKSRISDTNLELIENIQPDIILFLAAFFAGIAASYTWVKQNLSSSLPGIAVTVALIPPLTSVGIGVVKADISVISDSLSLFIINIFGIAVSSLIIFSLFGFSKLQREEEKLINQEEIENLSNVKSKLENTKEKLEYVNEKIEEKAKDVKSSDKKI